MKTTVVREEWDGEALASFVAEAEDLLTAIETSRGNVARIREHVWGLEQLCVLMRAEVGPWEARP